MENSRNPFVIGAIAGSVATLVKEVVGQTAVRTGAAPFDGIQKAAAMIIPRNKIRTSKGFATGVVMDMAIGTTLASGMALIHTKKIARMNALTGSLVGFSAWAFWYGALGSKVSGIRKTTPQGALVSAVWHITYGAVAGALINALSKPDTEPITRPSANRRVTTRRPKSATPRNRTRGMWQ